MSNRRHRKARENGRQHRAQWLLEDHDVRLLRSGLPTAQVGGRVYQVREWTPTFELSLQQLPANEDAVPTPLELLGEHARRTLEKFEAEIFKSMGVPEEIIGKPSASGYSEALAREREFRRSVGLESDKK